MLCLLDCSICIVQFIIKLHNNNNKPALGTFALDKSRCMILPYLYFYRNLDERDYDTVV